MKPTLLLFFLLISFTSCKKELTSSELLSNSIEFHDPNNNWKTFDGSFTVVMKTPDQSDRISDISIDIPNEIFEVSAKRDSVETYYGVIKDSCVIKLNGKSEISSEDMKIHRLSCERANLYKNYYTYLYGLPMKLMDDSTILSTEIEEKDFKGKSYLVLRAEYPDDVGSDIWYFYFDPETYAMEVYQFFKKDKAGNEDPESGEYILLEGLEEIKGIKMPKNRKWYFNKDDSYLGTDHLQKNENT